MLANSLVYVCYKENIFYLIKHIVMNLFKKTLRVVLVFTIGVALIAVVQFVMFT